MRDHRGVQVQGEETTLFWQVGPSKHATSAERADRGRAARSDAPRASHAAFEPPEGRDPIGLLMRQAESRVPELVPIRYGRMLASAFTFYRGGASIMANDLAATPRSGLNAQLCGDAHLSNFGGFASPERTLVFDLNDFDETLPGPFEWDVKRLAASLEICGRDRGFADRDRRAAVVASVRSYREAMRQFAGMTNLDVWYSRMDVDQLADRLRQANAGHQSKILAKGAAKARTKDSLKAFNKLTRQTDDGPRIVSDPPLIVPIAELAPERAAEIEQEIQALFQTYLWTLQRDRRVLLEGFRTVDLGRKVVGVGSVGTRAWIVLLLGKDDADPLFLQVKEAEASVLEPILGRSAFGNHGQRVVEGQRMMQAATDIFLGWIHNPRGLDGQPRDFYVRQLWDWKASVDLDAIVPRGLELYAQVCGWTLARAHARSGDRIAIAAYLGKGDAFDRAVTEFAASYADLNERDYGLLVDAVRSGRIEATEGI
jgi:uncharacterized protein (DUF2252 family)